MDELQVTSSEPFNYKNRFVFWVQMNIFHAKKYWSLEVFLIDCE